MENKKEVGLMTSQQQQTLFNFQQKLHIPMIIAVRVCSKGMNTWLKTKRLSCRGEERSNRLLLNSNFPTSYKTFWNLDKKSVLDFKLG